MRLVNRHISDCDKECGIIRIVTEAEEDDSSDGGGGWWWWMIVVVTIDL